ncbi:hypothetical protein D8S78_15675 [Natrialba swarupiae]|nr:hypothetical protein [Natrialba swarupiae]
MPVDRRSASDRPGPIHRSPYGERRDRYAPDAFPRRLTVTTFFTSLDQLASDSNGRLVMGLDLKTAQRITGAATQPRVAASVGTSTSDPPALTG